MDVLTVARVRRAHGLAGEVLVHAETDDGAEVFRADRRFGLRVERGGETVVREVTLTESRPHRGGYLLRFQEIADRDTAQTLLGAELVLERDELRPLDDEEYFLHELVGLEVIDERQGNLGPIVDVYDTAGQVLAGVRVDGRERLFPLHREFVRKIELDERRVEVALPAGLLEL